MATGQKPQVGDLIEIFRWGYRHWAIYVGDDYIIHVTVHSDFPRAASHSMLDLVNDKAVVKKEKLSDVAGNYKYIINNQLDEKYKPRPIEKILKKAESYVGKELPYCVVLKNCEHFVTNLRYGKPEFRQVRIVAGSVFAEIIIIVVAFVVSLFLRK